MIAFLYCSFVLGTVVLAVGGAWIAFGVGGAMMALAALAVVAFVVATR